jgi:hypothetical protein
MKISSAHWLAVMSTARQVGNFAAKAHASSNAVQSGHHDVGDERVRPELFSHAQGVLSALDGDRFIFLVVECLRQMVGHWRVIINHQYSNPFATVGGVRVHLWQSR